MHKETSHTQLQEFYLELNQHLLNDSTPSAYLSKASAQPEFQIHPFDMLYRLKSTKQSPVYHPEGNVWNHTMLVIDEAAKRKTSSKNAPVFLWAALLHDIGKPTVTKVRKGKITSYEHEKIGAVMAGEFLSKFSEDLEFIEQVTALVKYHMQMLFVINELTFARIPEMIKSSDIEEIALLGLCDRLGRKGSSQDAELKNMELFLQKCNAQGIHE